MTGDARLAKLTTGLGPGRWPDPPKPLTLTQQVCAAIIRGRDDALAVDQLAGADLELTDELTDDNITALRARLFDEIADRQNLAAALQAVLDKRAPAMTDTTKADRADTGHLLTTGEVAARFRIGQHSVTRWVREGRITPAFRTPGGQFRFYKHVIDELMGEEAQR